MDAKGKEKGILKLEPRQRPDAKLELTPQGSYERPPASPQPSVDRLSVTWADPGSMTSSGVNLFHMPPDTPAGNEVKFSPSAGDGSEDEDYSSLSAVLRQRRASVRRSRKGRTRRPSSPFLPDENRPRRRSSVFTTSSGDTAISIDEQPVVTQEQIFENIHLHKEVLGSVKQQPLEMRRKLKIVHQAKGYVKRHEGQLQERLAQSKSTRDIYARFNILLATKWQQIKREAANMSNLLIPWELRIKEIESHFGSVVASYFTFLRWLFWVNLVIGFVLLVFVIIPEYLTANPLQDGERKIIMDDEHRNATNLLTLWEFEGVLKYSPIFYGYYSNVERDQYRMPLAYFLTGLVVYIYSFVAILRKMAENSRMSKLSEKEDECIFSWKLFTGWDFMIGNAETAHNRIASVILGFKEALLEEAEKKKNLRNWRIISLRAMVNICVIILLAVSAFAVVTVVSRSDDNPKIISWWRENETTIVVTVITITFPVLFELLGLLEHYHPRKQLRLQLARIMLLNLLNLYSLIFALFSKIEGMSKELVSLQPSLNMNATVTSENSLNITENLITNLPKSCIEIAVPCLPCNKLTIPKYMVKNTSPSVKEDESKLSLNTVDAPVFSNIETKKIYKKHNKPRSLILQIPTAKRGKKDISEIDEANLVVAKEMEKVRNISRTSGLLESSETLEIYDNESDYNYDLFSVRDTEITAETNTDTETNLYTSTTPFFPTDYTDPSMINEPFLSSTVSTDRNTITWTDTNIAWTDTDNITWTDTTIKDNIDNGHTTINDDIYDMDTTTTTTTIATTTDLITSNDVDTTKYTDVFVTSMDYKTEINTKSSSSSYEFNTKTDTDRENDVDSSSTSFEMTEYDITTEITSSYKSTENMFISSSSYLSNTLEYVTICPNMSFNCSINCGDKNVTQIFFMSNCNVVDMKCYVTQCTTLNVNSDINNQNKTNLTMIDAVFIDTYHRKMYNLTISTKKKLLKLCWETMFGQELVKLTMMDLVFVLLGTLFMDFFRALFVRYMNRCWCWDLEKKCPEYGDFKIAENILHLINNQGMVWMGMFFSPGLVVLNVVKLMIMMYLRSWAVMTCNVPHEVVFRVSKSNNFYLALLLTMLFLCVLPVGYTIVWVTPSWHCGPFSEYDKIFKILTSNIYKILPTSLNFALEYIASPAIVIPLLVLLILIIYYLTSLTNSLREANNDLKIQLRRERTEERRKMFQLADTRRRGGSSSIDNTPFARWKKALPSLPLSKSIDSDDRKTTCDVTKEPTIKAIKKKGGIFAKIVGLAIDKRTDGVSNDTPQLPKNIDEETDSEFHETLPNKVLKIKDISIIKNIDSKKKVTVEFKTEDVKKELNKLCVESEKQEDRSDKKAVLEKFSKEKTNEDRLKSGSQKRNTKQSSNDKDAEVKRSSESSKLSKQNDSFGSAIPVITISTTESDDEPTKPGVSKTENETKMKQKQEGDNKPKSQLKRNKNCSDLKSLRRQSSVDSINENKNPKEKDFENNGHKYQYSI